MLQEELLGRGQFGDVRRGKWNGSLVAVKQFQSADARCGFWDEVRINYLLHTDNL